MTLMKLKTDDFESDGLETVGLETVGFKTVDLVTDVNVLLKGSSWLSVLALKLLAWKV